MAWHDRRVGKPTLILEPIHYLAARGRTPGVLDHAPVFGDGKLPACFAGFHAERAGHHGAAAGSRRFARVVQLLGEHPMTRVSQAIEACRGDHLRRAEAVIQRTRRSRRARPRRTAVRRRWPTPPRPPRSTSRGPT